jgi:hypothetical protein
MSDEYVIDASEFGIEEEVFNVLAHFGRVRAEDEGATNIEQAAFELQAAVEKMKSRECDRIVIE